MLIIFYVNKREKRNNGGRDFGGKRTLKHSLLGMKISSAVVEISMEVPQKTKNRTAI
jgi:hypothetical protein